MLINRISISALMATINKDIIGTMIGFCNDDVMGKMTGLVDPTIITNTSALQYQAISMKQYLESGKEPIDYLTRPTGLTVVITATNNNMGDDTDIITWKLPCSRAGTVGEVFRMDDGRIYNNHERYIKAKKMRNPAADIPEAIATLQSLESIASDNDEELILHAYNSGLYYPGELESLYDDMRMQKKIIGVHMMTSNNIKPYYDTSLNEQRAATILETLTYMGNYMSPVWDIGRNRTKSIINDLKLVVEHDPRQSVREAGKNALSYIKEKVGQ